MAELPRLAGSHGKEGSIMEPHSEAVAVSAVGSHATVSMRTLLCLMRIDVVADFRQVKALLHVGVLGWCWYSVNCFLIYYASQHHIYVHT